ncbi:MAG: hypothetical protein J5679_01385 [Alphaproteobacteria bacterium]|nr:hypothetical protein [Alphaproteobacteria bacterium]
MNTTEFLSSIKSRGATIYAPAQKRDIELANNALQSRRCAMFPAILIDLYNHASAINLGAGYIFGPIENTRGLSVPIPSIVDININLVGMPEIRGKTIFGRNDLFWFAFDAFGTFYMLDNLNLRTLRKYDDPYRAITDCLLAGKF